MKLKKLTIFGFKSFAERVVLDFDCEIIGIVGPNGCGKSNIVDAFRWVMGEQSAKSLRGDKMHDVLFAGTDKRKGLNYAEVSVWLTEINGELPLPYNEMTITRRLHRSGESEYFINKEPARLKDIQSLFLGSGIGRNAFSIFEQGKLDQIIHLSPLERRVIFDDAAGTSRFLQRKKETLRKLSTVTENYCRVQDVHAEIEKQARQLKKQASQAKSFQENQQRLKELEKTILLVRLQTLDQQSAGLERELACLKKEIEAGEQEMAQLNVEFDFVKRSVQEEELQVKQLSKELHLCETKTRVLEAEIQQQKHRLHEIKKREESVKLQLADVEKEQESLFKEKGSKTWMLSSASQGQEQKKTDLEIKKEAYNAVDKEMANVREGIKKIQTEHLTLMQEQGRLQSKLQEKTFRYEAHLARFQILNALEKTHEGASSALNQHISLQRGKVEALTVQIDTYKKELVSVENELYALRTELTKSQQEEQVLAKQITETESHQKTLKRLQEDMEGFSPAAKALLKEAKNEKSPLYRKIEPLFEYLTPHKGYEELLASAMRPYSETLVVASEEDLCVLLDFAKKKKIVDFSVAVQSRFRHPNGILKPGVLAAHMEKNAVAYHFTQNYTLVEEGNFFDALDVFFHSGSGKKLSNPFQRQSELKSLAEKALELRADWAKHRGRQTALLEQMKLTEQVRTDRSEIHRKKEMDLIQENFKLQQALADLEKLKREISSVSKEKENLGNLPDEELEIDQLKLANLELQQKLATFAATLQYHEELLESSQMTLKVNAQHLQAAETLFQKAQLECQQLHQQIQILEVKQHKSEADEKRLAQEIENMHHTVEYLLLGINTQEEQLEESTSHLQSLLREVEAHERVLAEAQKRAEALDKSLVQKRKESSIFGKKYHEVEIALAQESSERRSIETELMERHGLAQGNWKERTSLNMPLHMPLEEMMPEVQRLRSALESNGPCNMTAIDEFQQIQERFDYLDKQLKDLQESKTDLEEMITTLDQESRKIFKQTFQKIRENFQKNFALLFTGGSADLTFTESSDILEAGIEIVAKPPGKQMRSISLLSGGEKCLTALALLFSVFEVRPAPFCILDEVDAPLDDSNIERFTHVLKQFIDKTQFIIVTHNKKTMSIADLLIGVSMEEKGVSKLISLGFEKNQRTVALL